MKKKYLNKSIVALLLTAFLVIIVSTLYTGFMAVYADSQYTQDYTQLTDEELDDLSARTIESDEAPQITVFTHGFGGGAQHWANDISEGGGGNFTYESDSMIEQLRKSIEVKDKSVTMYAVKIDEKDLNTEYTSVKSSQSEILNLWLTDNVGSKQLKHMYEGQKYIISKELALYKCDEKQYSLDEDNKKETHITSNDVSKHIILVLDMEQSERSNDYVYAQFEYILDSITYQYRQLTGDLPTYNLIGHSRGGITNMQYALAHPYNVASIYSMGTPYNGSAFGSTADFFLELGGMEKSGEYYNDGTIDYPPGVLDILNFDLNESYKSFWNTYYDEWYSHIKFRPIGSYVTIGFILQTLVDNFMEDGSVGEDVLRGVAAVAEGALYAAELITISDHLAATIIGTLVDTLVDLIVDDIPDAPAWIKVINNLNVSYAPYEHLGTSMRGLLVYEDDLFIDLNSQVADGYKGAVVKVRLMDTFDQVNGKKSDPAAGVGHNLETHQPDIVNYVVENILDDIDLTQNDIFTVRYQGENFEECVITRVKAGNATVLNIPEKIGDAEVVGIDRLSENVMIGKDSFSTENENLQTVIIPSSVKNIGRAAFYGMKNLQKVQFASGSQLESIEAYAFMNSGLSGTVTLPDTVNRIGSFAFAYCSDVTGYSLNGNDIYSSNGVLYSNYNDNEELIQYPAGKAATSFTIPSSVGVIGTGAFVGSTNIRTLNLGNNVHRIGAGAFVDCSNLATIQNGNNVGFVEMGAFDGTEWIDSNENELSIGSVLIRYNGTNKDYILPYKYTAICSLAFDESNVENLIITNTQQIISICYGAIDENICVKVPRSKQTEYSNNTQWAAASADIVPIESLVKFDSNCDTIIPSRTVYYGEYQDFDVPENSGYIFVGWSLNGENLTDESGSTFDKWRELDDVVTLEAVWRPESYIIKISLENDELWLEAEDGNIDLSDTEVKVKYDAIIGDSFNERFLNILKNDKQYNVTGKIITGFMIDGRVENWSNSDSLPDLGDNIEIEIELIYEDEVHTIIFETNSSQGTVTKQIRYGEEIDYPDLKTTTEEKFAGWYEDSQFTKEFTDRLMGDLTPGKEGTGTITIYAKWNDACTISFETNGGSACAPISTYEEETITLPTSIKLGYDGTWGDYDFGDSYFVTGTTTLEADWIGKYYTLTFKVNGGYGGTSSAKVQYGGAMPTITYPTRAGHKLDYFTDPDGTKYYMNGQYDTRTYMLTQNLTLTAHWSEAFLRIENLGWDGGWKIKVTNTSSTKITVEYNKKMCFLGDAQKWTGLKDIDSFTLESGESKILDGDEVIKGYLFATSVTFSYEANDYRYITYADGLYDDGSINVKYNRILA